MKNNDIRDTRLFDAIDHIDEKHIGAVAHKYDMTTNTDSYGMSKYAKKRFYTRLAAMAAGFLIITGLISAMPAIISNLNAHISSGRVEINDLVDPLADIYDPYKEFLEKHQFLGTYYGMYGECHVTYVNAFIDPPASTEICGYVFDNVIPRTMSVYYKDDIYSLQDAYALGYLSDEDIAALHKHHTQTQYYSCSPQSGPVELYSFEKDRILYTARNGSYGATTKQYLKGYGRYNGAVAFSYDERTYVIESRETVGQFEFIYPDSEKLQIYLDYAVYSLSEAYEQNIIDDDFLLSIYIKYRKAHPDLYGDEGTSIQREELHHNAKDFSRYVSEEEDIYFGMFGKCHVLVNTVDIEYSDEDYKVGDLDFSYLAPMKPWIYYDLRYYTVSDAYNLGLISKSVAKEIHQYINESVNIDFVIEDDYRFYTVIEDYEARRILNDYHKEFPSDDFYSVKHKVEFYGNDDDTYSVMIDPIDNGTLSWERYGDTNMVFIYSGDQRMLIYKDGAFYSLAEAYMQNALPKFTIDRYTKTHPDLYRLNEENFKKIYLRKDDFYYNDYYTSVLSNQISNYYVLIPGYYSAPQTPSSQTVNGYSFELDRDCEIYVYLNGLLLTLEDCCKLQNNDFDRNLEALYNLHLYLKQNNKFEK